MELAWLGRVNMAIKRLTTEKERNKNIEDKKIEQEVRKKLKDLGLNEKHIDRILRGKSS